MTQREDKHQLLARKKANYCTYCRQRVGELKSLNSRYGVQWINSTHPTQPTTSHDPAMALLSHPSKATGDFSVSQIFSCFLFWRDVHLEGYLTSQLLPSWFFSQQRMHSNLWNTWPTNPMGTDCTANNALYCVISSGWCSSPGDITWCLFALQYPKKSG